MSVGDAGLSARAAVERVVAIPAGTEEYAGVPPVSAGTTTR